MKKILFTLMLVAAVLFNTDLMAQPGKGKGKGNGKAKHSQVLPQKDQKNKRMEDRQDDEDDDYDDDRHERYSKAQKNKGQDHGKGHKVTICHKGKNITIARAALDAHLAHGDYVGGCGTVTQRRAPERDEEPIFKRRPVERDEEPVVKPRLPERTPERTPERETSPKDRKVGRQGEEAPTSGKDDKIGGKEEPTTSRKERKIESPGERTPGTTKDDKIGTQKETTDKSQKLPRREVSTNKAPTTDDAFSSLMSRWREILKFD